jgi:hypothetical protein
MLPRRGCPPVEVIDKVQVLGHVPPTDACTRAKPLNTIRIKKDYLINELTVGASRFLFCGSDIRLFQAIRWYSSRTDIHTS